MYKHQKGLRKAKSPPGSRKGFCSAIRLFSDAEFFNQSAITLKVVFLQVVQQAAAFAHQLHEATVRGEIFFVLLQMTGDLRDAFSEQGDLSFDGTRVRSGGAKLCKNARFFFFGY